MAKDWIKKAIKHPGRCTPGSPNYDCPKGSPQWNLAQTFKKHHGFHKEFGGMAASDNINMGYYSNPMKYFAQSGLKVSSQDSVRHQANKILQYEQLRGASDGSPLPQYSDPIYMDMLMNKIYPEVKKIMPNASAMELGEAMDFVFNAGWDKSANKITKDPRAYALQEYYRKYDNSKLDNEGKWSGRKNAPYSFDEEYNNTIGKLPENERRIMMNKGRDWYYKNINNPAPGVLSPSYNNTWYGRIWNTNDYKDFNPNNPNFVPKKELGGYISDDDCLECGGKVYANNGLNIDSTLNTNKNLNWVDRLYQKNTPTIFLPGEAHPSTHYMESADNFVYPTIIQNEDGKLEYLGNKAYDYAMKTNTAIKFKTPEEAEYFAKNYKKGKGVLKKFNMGGKIKAEDGLNPKPLIPPKPEQIDFEMERQLPPDASYERDVRKFSWNNRDTAPEQIKLDSSYMLYKKPKGYSNVYNKGKLIGYTVDNKILIPGEPNFQNGGIVKAWIQKFSKGGYIADEGFPGGQELTQPTTNYANWGNYGSQNSFLTPDQINQKPFQNNNNMQVPMAQSNMPQNIGTNYKTAYDASNDQVNKDNQLANSMMKSSSKGLSDPVSMGLDVGGKSLDATANLLGSLGKDNSKAKAFGQGASGAMNVAGQVTAPFKDIPIAGKAIDAVGKTLRKTLGFFIGGALGARRQGIENEEMDKYNKVQEYNSRNSVALYQPSNFGQYMSKYGSNIKNLEQRLIDDIFSDYDKYMQK